MYDLDSYNSESIALESEETQSNIKPKPEKVILSKELIRKSTPYTQALDTRASLPITNQLYLFRDGSLKLTTRVPI